MGKSRWLKLLLPFTLVPSPAMETPVGNTPKAQKVSTRKGTSRRLRVRVAQVAIFSVIMMIVQSMQRLGMGEMMEFPEKDEKDEKQKGKGGKYAALLRLLRNNAFVYITGYGLPYLVFHCTTRYWYRKFNQKPTSSVIFQAEIKRWVRSCLIGTAMDFATKRTMAIGWLPRMDDTAKSYPRMLLEVFLTSEWSDIHFYFIHRFLHVGPDWLYTHIHSVHHQSFNPNPFSGLSFHPVESMMYFSSVPMYVMINAVLGLRTSAFGYTAMKLFNDLGPSAGHDGYTSPHHYLHHTKKHWNFGASPRLDKFFGTILRENPFKSQWVGTP